jgi:hypothetical protein
MVLGETLGQGGATLMKQSYCSCLYIMNARSNPTRIRAGFFMPLNIETNKYKLKYRKQIHIG